MVEIKSQRAKKLLLSPQTLRNEKSLGMKKFSSDEIKIWAEIEWAGNNVKNLSFFADVPDYQKIFLEALGTLLKNKPISYLDQISVRECEAFLRDKNSEAAVTGMSEQDENLLKKIFKWLRSWSQVNAGQKYHFHYEKGPFNSLKLVDKIRELKAFLSSSEILTLYSDFAAPELIDVEDLTVYLRVPYDSEKEISLLHELHILGVEAFQEENLNFIPEP